MLPVLARPQKGRNVSDQTEPAAAAETDAAEDVAENPLEEEAEIAADYLEELLDIADLDGDIDTFIEGDGPMCRSSAGRRRWSGRTARCWTRCRS